MKKFVTPTIVTLLFSTAVLSCTSAFAVTQGPAVGKDPIMPNTAETPVSANLKINQNPVAPVVPSGNDGGADSPTNINHILGIAYAPKQLSVDEMLNDAGQQKLALSNNNITKYNVGVQDKTRRNDQQWTLKVKLSWSGTNANYMAGTSIEATNGNVQENTAGTLSTLSDGQVTTNAQTLKISDTETSVMESVKGKTMNGVYNYQFESPELVIPNVENVPADTYTGTINWNLEHTP